MTTLEKWKLLRNQASTQLKTVEQHKFPESFLEYNCEPSFEDHFNILVIWKGSEGRWSKNVWDIMADREHYFDQDNVPRKSVVDKTPNIIHQSGKLNYNELQELQKMARSLSIVPIIEPLPMFTLDGAMHSISLGADDCRITFSWHTLPNEWQELQVLADYLIDLCKPIIK